MASGAEQVCRWGARALGLPFLWFVAAHLLADGLPNPLAFTPVEGALFACLIGALAGMVLLWRRELAGGLLTVAGVAAFLAVNLAATGDLARGPWFFLMAAPGVLALAAWRLSRRPAGAPQAGR